MQAQASYHRFSVMEHTRDSRLHHVIWYYPRHYQIVEDWQFELESIIELGNFYHLKDALVKDATLQYLVHVKNRCTSFAYEILYIKGRLRYEGIYNQDSSPYNPYNFRVVLNVLNDSAKTQNFFYKTVDRRYDAFF